MKNSHSRICLVALALLLSACDVPTIVIEPPPPLMQAYTATPRPTLTFTAIPTNTASPTTGPSPTPTISPTPLPGVPVVTVSQSINCRTGPGRAYKIVGALLAGGKVEIRAGEPAGHFWLIDNPNRAGEQCWITGQYARVTGKTEGLTVLQPPPTLTPDPAGTQDDLRKVQAGGASLVEKIYAHPDTGAAVLGYIRDGEAVTLLPDAMNDKGRPYLREDEFSYIRTAEGLEGWVRDYSEGRGGFPVLATLENWRPPEDRFVG